MINTHLTGKTFLVGERFTLGDISLFNSLVIPFGFILDGGFRKAMPAVSAWFERVSKIEHVVKVAGNVKMCDKPVKPVDPTKIVAATPKAAAAAKKDDDFDPFAEETTDDKAAKKAANALADAAKEAKKKVKPEVIAKSIIVFEVKPISSTTDID